MILKSNHFIRWESEHCVSFCILKHVQSLISPGQLFDNTVESIENKFGTNSEFLALVGWLVDVEQIGESLF